MDFFPTGTHLDDTLIWVLRVSSTINQVFFRKQFLILLIQVKCAIALGGRQPSTGSSFGFGFPLLCTEFKFFCLHFISSGMVIWLGFLTR